MCVCSSVGQHSMRACLVHIDIVCHCRSDVLGHVLPMIGSVIPMIGSDWSHSQAGIAQLYQMIHRNGYKFLYLSARAIGQSQLTRDYIRSVRQSNITLPDGPLLLSPSSLMSAFHKWVHSVGLYCGSLGWMSSLMPVVWVGTQFVSCLMIWLATINPSTPTVSIWVQL